jgi:hypothetical protein
MNNGYFIMPIKTIILSYIFISTAFYVSVAVFWVTLNRWLFSYFFLFILYGVLIPEVATVGLSRTNDPPKMLCPRVHHQYHQLEKTHLMCFRLSFALSIHSIAYHFICILTLVISRRLVYSFILGQFIILALPHLSCMLCMCCMCVLITYTRELIPR